MSTFITAHVILTIRVAQCDGSSAASIAAAQGSAQASGNANNNANGDANGNAQQANNGQAIVCNKHKKRSNKKQ